MHEVSLMEQTLHIAIENARQHGSNKIERLKMRLGEMSGVVPEALQFAFDALKQGTIAAEAILDIETVPVICYCHRCQTTFHPAHLFYECPDCGELSRDTQSGREIELSSLELSDQ